MGSYRQRILLPGMAKTSSVFFGLTTIAVIGSSMPPADLHVSPASSLISRPPSVPRYTRSALPGSTAAVSVLGYAMSRPRKVQLSPKSSVRLAPSMSDM